MNRSGLRALMKNLILASLPAASFGCVSSPAMPDQSATVDQSMDQAVVVQDFSQSARPPIDATATVITDLAKYDFATDSDAGVPPFDGFTSSPSDGLANPPSDAGAPPDGACMADPLDASPGVCPPCEWEVDVTGPVTTVDDMGNIDPTDCFNLCMTTCYPTGGWYCNVEKQLCSGKTRLLCSVQCGPGVGRRPAGLETMEGLGLQGSEGPLGRLFAHMAWLEAASVEAFRVLARELTAHGAPRRLIRAALRAVSDEQRHARITGRLARRFGAVAPIARIETRPVRSLEAIAVENAIEGCVRESYGAIVATWQGQAATDPGVRRAMAAIAVDETRHAELAWAVAAWSEPLLSANARRSAVEARLDTAATLVREMDLDPEDLLVRVAGLPSGPQSRSLSSGFAAALARPGYF